MPVSAVFDTNILFSATAWRGRPFDCVELARNGVVLGVSCEELLIELAEKLELKLAFSKQQSEETVADLLGFLRLVEIAGAVHGVSRDPDDDKVLECAIEGNAQYIVSGDKDLLSLGTYKDVKIVRAAEFLGLALKP